MNSFHINLLILGFSTVLGAFILNTMSTQNSALTTQGEASDVILPIFPTNMTDSKVILSPKPIFSTAPTNSVPSKSQSSVPSKSPTQKPIATITLSPTTAPTPSTRQFPTPTPFPTPLPTLQPQTPSSPDTLFLWRDGFGRDVTGGFEAKRGSVGTILQVTKTTDDMQNPETGSLRWALMQKAPLYITFATSGTIELKGDVLIPSNTTIDARGQGVIINKYGFNIMNVDNVIVTNLTFINGVQAGVLPCDTGENTGDAITIRNSKNVWVHKNYFSKYCDGLVDIVEGSHNITISWNEFFDHNKVMLIGNDDERKDIDTKITVTVHHNYFHDTKQRHPRVRFGKVDFYNNYISDWKLYGVGHAAESEIIVEENIFEATENTRASNKMTTPKASPGYLKLQGNNVLLNEAELTSFEPQKVFVRPYSAKINEADADLMDILKHETGPDVQNSLLEAFETAQSSHNFADLNSDGVINTTDLLFCMEDYGAQLTFEEQDEGESLTCDTDGNGFTNAIDYSRVVNFYGMSEEEANHTAEQEDKIRNLIN